MPLNNSLNKEKFEKLALDKLLRRKKLLELFI